MGPLGALLGRSWPLLVGFLGAFGALLEALGPQDGAQEAPRRLPGGTPEAKMEPQRPSNEPQEASGVRESTGKQLGAPRRNGKRPASARSARARASRENSLNLPPGPPDQGELEKFAAKPPDYGKRERFTAEPPDYGKRERFTAGPPDHEKNARALPWERQTNAANNGAHGCINGFLRLRFPFSLWAGFGPVGGRPGRVTSNKVSWPLGLRLV